MKAHALKKQLENNQTPISMTTSPSQPLASVSSINSKSMEEHKINLEVALSAKTIFLFLRYSEKIPQELNVSLRVEYTKAEECLSTIEDPLWRRICQDVMIMMGPASLLKIWECTLGEVYSQNKSIDIYSPTEKAAQFINQYSFVIFGSLKPYFPALKQISVKAILP